MAEGRYAWDRVLIPAKRLVYHRLFRADYQRYLAFRARVAAVATAVGVYERDTIRTVRRLVGPGDVAVDVGANFGSYTSTLANLVGPAGAVHAFEPQEAVYSLLQSRFAGVPHVHLVQAALAEKAGVAHFVVPSIAGDVPEPALGSLRLDSGGSRAVSKVTVMTLDVYCAPFERLRFLKIDAEGGDLDVLRGGRETLRRLRPVVQVECNDAALLPAFVELAEELGYDLDPRSYSTSNRLLVPRGYRGASVGGVPAARGLRP